MLSVLGMDVVRGRLIIMIMLVATLNGSLPDALKHELALAERDLAATHDNLLRFRSSCSTAAAEVTARLVARLTHATLAHHSHHLGLVVAQVSLRADTKIIFTALRSCDTHGLVLADILLVLVVVKRSKASLGESDSVRPHTALHLGE